MEIRVNGPFTGRVSRALVTRVTCVTRAAPAHVEAATVEAHASPLRTAASLEATRARMRGSSRQTATYALDGGTSAWLRACRVH